MFQKLKALLNLKRPHRYRLAATEEELLCYDRSRLVNSVKWSDVTEIQGFKRDFFTSDVLCLLVKSDNIRVIIEINEDMDGFLRVDDQLKYLKYLQSDWRVGVVLPPFSENRVTLFKREIREVE